MSGLCGTCRHWRLPTERTDFHDAVRLSYDSDKWDDDWDAKNAAEREADRKFGECLLIDLGSELEPDNIPLAVTRDASDYVATLYTQAEFGCVLHEPDDPAIARTAP